MALIFHISGATSIDANWVGGVRPTEIDVAVFDNTSSGGSVDYLNCLGVWTKPTFAGVLTQDADTYIGKGGCLFEGGEFVGGDYDWISQGGFVQTGGQFEIPRNKFQNKSYTDNLLDVEGLDMYTLAGLDLYHLHSGVEIYVNNAIFFRSTGDVSLLDSKSVASTSNWGTFTWGEILYKIRSEINEPSPGFFTDEELMIFYNEAQLYFARETKFLKIEQAFPVKNRPSSPPYQYAMMPNGFLGLISVALQSKTDARDIKYLLKTGLVGRSNQSYKDQLYYLVDHGEVRITNEIDVDTTNLLIRYYMSPSPFADPEDLEVLTNVYDEYLEDVLMLVTMKCHKKRKEYEEYNFLERRFNDRLEKAIKSEGRRQGGGNNVSIVP